ncbi:translesion error-prone DNA polymerase V autoproteolytic subunit [Methylobacillus caricis]|uniref:LexA family protein n=1 Tax=Methylobacillus caricis TaxID=1971611 RepID=UPI001CFFA5D7|nr:translesion error-prone DNA polymerase V autoproteolytic subunit [Methylobacillus caricis]MCB5187366.1 translesion error-prone DNA polymerase V autoproteolytic subunit [Methylobacillus caricis]
MPESTLPLALPQYSSKVRAGQSHFPSPAQDYEQEFLDLNHRFITNPPATFLFVVAGDSMIGAGIYPGSTIIVDRSKKAKSGSIVIVDVEGEWMVKRLKKTGRAFTLLSENPAYPPIELQPDQSLIVFGVVTTVIHEPQ